MAEIQNVRHVLLARYTPRQRFEEGLRFLWRLVRWLRLQTLISVIASAASSGSLYIGLVYRCVALVLPLPLVRSSACDALQVACDHHTDQRCILLNTSAGLSSIVTPFWIYLRRRHLRRFLVYAGQRIFHGLFYMHVVQFMEDLSSLPYGGKFMSLDHQLQPLVYRRALLLAELRPSTRVRCAAIAISTKGAECLHELDVRWLLRYGHRKWPQDNLLEHRSSFRICVLRWHGVAFKQRNAEFGREAL